MAHDCLDCGRPARPGGRRCARCYMRAYRATPTGRERVNAASRASIARLRRDPRWRAKRKRWVRNWQRRVGLYVPDLQALRRAIKRLDAALAAAEERP